ncbi:hydroxyectoine utilization dehydratase EutB [Sinorhizobium meliloti]|uniref:hydroxyectoine utilization dehydratase EutB n=1 Tax=Rhizobium meliloti TaxID=382 RepID=UPI000FDCC099|nr:hydroxyectoine utilization dehydratase EutB [Sinorhizobium meliloti]MDW9366718.1 hydroxyectoine utilization dehydratase EutB [Sinorhizobium meliloti]MDW9406940.1 hydroxyectoine utilization dehydratase EutB [Sinorhizobium meliloti]MDW9428245.1 hydroxyectoine utilization dehydratase EutB [Sinorhizobium meliloti]MDW9452328.1 hydroxyectoine utilization dehydratase EutB [Sinorhizobium meliloti]MDW9465052.1 hydroxyectoine utilization dehydratase EutB [Sinorhizobium meliloti]
MSASLPVTIDDIEVAARRISGRVLTTPLAMSGSLSELCGVPVGLKLEHHQTTGSFKLRGATNAVLSLSAGDRALGVIAASTGNHGRALAHAAKAEGSVATICMSHLVPVNKVSEIRRLGANVRIVGNSQDEAQEEVERLVAENGLVMVPAFDHPAIVAGQGTLGLEVVAQMPDVAMVLVPVSGGGLAAGVAAAVKARRPATRVIGLTMERGAAMKASFAAGGPVLVDEQPSLADSLGGGIGLDNRVTFRMCRELLDDIILLTEAEVAAGMRHAYAEEREIVEGAGAVGISALLAGKIKDIDGPIAVIISGRNVDMDLHLRVMNGETDPFREEAA